MFFKKWVNFCFDVYVSRGSWIEVSMSRDKWHLQIDVGHEIAI